MSNAGRRRRNEEVATGSTNFPRRWDDDVIFKNQARGTEDKRKKEFVNVSPTESPEI
jgi:protein CWC15